MKTLSRSIINPHLHRRPRFDVMCAGPSAAKNAPQAGKWFEAYFMDLVHNANPTL